VPTIKKITLLPLILIMVMLPFFEGGETSLGLFLIHSIVLFALAFAALSHSRLVVPRFLLLFLPFFLILVISTVLSSYKFAAVLKLWDYFAAGLWAILVCTQAHHEKEKIDASISWIFLATAASTIAAILIYNTNWIMRISASFVNPNDYACYALVLLCFGIYCFEREAQRIRKTVLGTLLVILLLSVGVSFSRGILLAIISLLFVVFFKRKPGKLVSALLVVLLLVSGCLVALRFRMYEDPLQYYRWKIWKSSIRGLVDDPYLGVGLGMLEYSANRFNFPADLDIGRFGKIARTADNQYVQILAETGFLGFFAFLFGWIGLAFFLRNLSHRFFYLKQAWLILTVTGLFSLPLQNTSILFLFLFLIVFATTMDSEKHLAVVNLQKPGRILLPVAFFALFIFGVYLPFRADQEFQLAIHSSDTKEADRHLANAVRYNPYQPYYRFTFIRTIVDANPRFDEKKWMAISLLLDDAIALNPLEYEFYLYKARVSRIMLEKDRTLALYSTAVSSYQNALDYNPFNVFLRLEFASFLARLQRYDIAESQARQALEMEPAFLQARLLLVEILLETKRIEQAKSEYARFQKDDLRYRRHAAYAPSTYVRTLLQVDPQRKQRIEERLKPPPS